MANDQMKVLDRLEGAAVLGSDGEKVGKLADIYFDEQTGKPEWGLVTTGMFGSSHSFVPLTTAQLGDDEIRLSVTKDQVKDAPRMDDDGELTQDEEATLARHYGLRYSEAPSDTGLPTGGGAPAPAPAPKAAGATDDAMTRSEEELHVGTVKRPKELVRLRKRIVTENVTKTVPVEREEVVVEREPITDANRDKAMRGPDLAEGEAEVVLGQGEVVVDKKVVPKERVHLDKTTTVEEQQVDETVAKEQIDIERQSAK